MSTSCDQCSIWLKSAAVFSVLFGLLSIFSGGAVLFGGDEAQHAAGAYVGLTPVLTVLPGEWGLPALLAVLLSPAASAWARRRSVGAGLTLSVLKLSAAQLRELPLPEVVPGAAVAAAQRVIDGHTDALDELAVVMTQAYGAPEEVLAWWRREAGRT